LEKPRLAPRRRKCCGMVKCKKAASREAAFSNKTNINEKFFKRRVNFYVLYRLLLIDRHSMPKKEVILVKNIFKLFVVLLTVVILLSGCAEEEIPAGLESQVWEIAPALDYGILEYEPLEVLPYYSGRCEFTSKNAWAETDMGYYYANSPYLYYADKVDLNKWVPVCNQPNCNHITQSRCAAKVYLPRFVIHDGRIYHEAFGGTYPNPANPKGDNGLVLVSMTINGDDKKVAYSLADAVSSGEGSASTRLSEQCWMYYAEDLNPDGTYAVKLFCIDDSGMRLLFEKHYDQEAMDEIDKNKYSNISGELFGERYYRYQALVPDRWFKMEADGYRYLDASLVSPYGGYIAGTTLRTFRPNDGYYDIDIETKEEIKLIDNRLQDSESVILLPNCIIESTLFNDDYEGQQAMTIFDGKTWHNVELPNELKQVVGANAFSVETVTSDSIIFSVNEMDLGTSQHGKVLYSISLKEEQWILKYLTTITSISGN